MQFGWSERLSAVALVISVLALGQATKSSDVATKAYDLSLTQDKRAQENKRPAFDIQITSASAPEEIYVDLEIRNRADINISPESVSISAPNGVGFAVDGPIIVGVTGIGNAPPRTISSVSLLGMGTLPPGEAKKLRLRAAAKEPPFPVGMEVQFAFIVRLADEQESILEFRYVRRINFG
jgi:hypothetical protein